MYKKSEKRNIFPTAELFLYIKKLIHSQTLLSFSIILLISNLNAIFSTMRIEWDTLVTKKLKSTF